MRRERLVSLLSAYTAAGDSFCKQSSETQAMDLRTEGA